MLAKFEVENFKSFKDKLVFELDKTKNYEFNPEYIKNGISTKNLIYGMNGSGKSNLGLAIFDIIKHVTTKNFPNNLYVKNYVCAYFPEKFVKFAYTFKFDKHELVYKYTKKNYETLVYEEVIINGETVIKADRIGGSIEIFLKGTEKLISKIESNKVSVIAFIRTHTNLDQRNTKNKVFTKFLEFVDHMLFFRSLDENEYIGLENGTEIITADIIKKNQTKALEEFLNKAGLTCTLKERDDEIFCCFNDKLIPIFDIASSGTKRLILFFFWLIRILDKKIGVSLLFIDEFDAFYHYELAEFVISNLKNSDVQLFLTTHDTNLMSSELLRPDCYFIIFENRFIRSLPYLTEREIRQAHNLEKLYKANAFSFN